jgi:AAA+ ATPase superfamily predicted ATPase
MANPFADFGTAIYGKRFIGRDHELRLIDSRLFSEGGFGSLAVIGLPRVGKTSLLLEAVQRSEEKLSSIRAVVVREDLGIFSSAGQFFRSLIYDLLNAIREKGWVSEAIELQTARMLSEKTLSFYEIREVFRAIRKSGVRPVCILDEFDSGRYLFAGKPECFHWIRELSSNPEFKASIILISKRRLPDIARIAGHDSNYWFNVLMTITLRPFSSDEVSEFYRRLESEGVNTNTETKDEAKDLCGQHPFLLDAFAYHAYEGLIQKIDLGLNWFRLTMRTTIREYYQQVITVLKDVEVLDKLIQHILGPQWNITQDDLNAMVDYGVICSPTEGNQSSFARGFDEYLHFVESAVEIWPLWRDTERSLRYAIENILQSKYGYNWSEEVVKYQPKLKKIIDIAKDTMAREKARFGDQAATSILAYTYPMDLYRFMAFDWVNLGEPLLGGDKQGWSVKFTLLSKIRTPLAHNRGEVVIEGERVQAEGICREILSRVKAKSGVKR